MNLVRDRARALTPRSFREPVRKALVRYGEITAGRRTLPDFLIIGTKRGGTTSLWNYLLQHPLVLRMFPAWNTKSTHYFEENWWRGEAWYRSHFPTKRQRRARERDHPGQTRVGEASPLYMFHPAVPHRVHTVIPQARLIALLRDPVERAYSHWKERRTEGTEPLSFVDALAAEQERTAGERARMEADPNYFSHAFDWYSYRARGCYVEHLEPWLALFPREQLLILTSEEFYRAPAATFQSVLAFLGLPAYDNVNFRVYNDRPSAPMGAPIREELAAYYRPYNEALAQRLGMELPWTGM